MSPCREWQGTKCKVGYGRRTAKRFSSQLIHRQIMEMVHGADAIKGKVVMHLCDNPACYRYDHLRIGTQADNIHDMMEKGRHASAGQTHCKNGHELDGSRQCSICKNAAKRAYKERRRKEDAEMTKVWLGRNMH